MPELLPCYLIHGTDHAKVGERRSRLRRLAEQISPGNIESFSGENGEPADVVAALHAMTFAVGRRFLIVDGIERWKSDNTEELEQALKEIPPETTVALFGREDGRQCVPKALIDAVKQAGGAVDQEQKAKARDMPGIAIAAAQAAGIRLDRESAVLICQRAGNRPARIEREVEKLAIYADGGELTLEEVTKLTGGEIELRVFDLADMLVAADTTAALTTLLDLFGQGERIEGLVPQIARTLRTAVLAADRLDAGEPPSEIKRDLRMPPFAADRLLRDLRGRDPVVLKQALTRLARLEAGTRGREQLQSETQAVRAVLAIAR